MLRIITIAILVLCGTIFGAQAQTLPTAPSTWKNEKGSLLTIANIQSDGTFAGTFVNNADGTFCKVDPYLVEGFFKADKIVFWVAFADRTDSTKNCATVTEWRGTFTTTVLDTTWSLAYPGQSGLILIGGEDKFELQP